MENELTDRTFWARYWKNYQYNNIPKKVVYEEYIPKSLPENASFIEIGGFPGINAAYFYKHICKDVTLVDFYVDPKMIHTLEERNQIPLNSIQWIESDFFTLDTPKQYDLVLSVGFIEHFDDTSDVIKRHSSLLKANGELLIVLPNFRGLNGLVQYLFDKENLRKHNLKCMEKALLLEMAGKLGLRDIRVQYTRKPMLWIEPKPTSGNKIKRTLIRYCGHALKLIPIRSRLLSPYIVLTAKK